MIKASFQGLSYAFALFSISFAFIIQANAASAELDLTFGTGGIAAYDFDGTPSNTDNDEAYDAAVQPDGKIVMVGRAYVSSSNRALAVMRFNADGTLDTTFGTNGRILNDYTTGGDEFWSVAIQPDGKILAAGYFNGTRTRIVARYNTDGTPDTTFGTNGVFTAPLAYSNNTVTLDCAEMLIQPDGKILIAGTHKHEAGADRFGLYRLNPDGTLDTAFGNNGEASARFTAAAPNLGDRPFGVALQADGKIVAAGYANSDDVAVARWNADGTLDTTFGAGGKVAVDLGTPDASAWSMTIQPDGKILTGGRVLLNSSDILLVRFNSDGSLDTTFDGDGMAMGDFGAFDHAYEIFVRDGKILTVGNSMQSPSSDLLIAQFNMDGSVDTDFGTAGAIKTSINAYDFTYSATFASDGKLIVGGLSQYSGLRGRDFMAVRYDFASAVPVSNLMDFDGDGKSDISVLRPVTGGTSQWWIRDSSNSAVRTVGWGLGSDVAAPADFDGDGKTDIAVWRAAGQGDPLRSYFYVLNSADSSLRAEQFGSTGDDPTIVGDWDGDGKADLSVYRNGSNGGQSQFYYRPTSQPATDFVALPWGIEGDLPIHGDFDGDGKLDAAVFRPADSVWYILQSSNSQARFDSWGLASDTIVSSDYDGDAKTDLAVFRDGVWYIKQSSNGQPRYETFGLSTDTPVPADFDGDGEADIAVYRSGVWYIQQSSSANTRYENFGAAADMPLQSIFVR